MMANEEKGFVKIFHRLKKNQSVLSGRDRRGGGGSNRHEKGKVASVPKRKNRGFKAAVSIPRR